MSREARNETEIIIRLVSDASFNAGKLCRHVKGLDDCTRLSEKTTRVALAAERSAEKIVAAESRPSASRAVLDKRDALLAL